MEIKYRLLKIIDTAGLSFLSPVVRLAAGEEPRKQLKDIGRWIVVPVAAMLMFAFLWSVIAPRHKTKSRGSNSGRRNRGVGWHLALP